MIPSGVKERGRGEGNKGKLIIRHKPKFPPAQWRRPKLSQEKTK